MNTFTNPLRSPARRRRLHRHREGSLDYGAACGTAQQVAFGDAPVGGTTHYEMYYGASSLAMMSIGFGRLPTPFDLGSLGAPGCLVYRNPAISHPIVTSTEGFGSIGLDLPMNEAFLGVQFSSRFFVLDVPANALGVVSTEAVETTVGQGS